MTIGERIRKLRNAKGLTIYKLSKETDISQNHISAIERNQRQPTIDTLSRLVIPLGISLAELFNEDTEATYLTNSERTLIENYRELPEEKAQMLIDLSGMLK